MHGRIMDGLLYTTIFITSLWTYDISIDSTWLKKKQKSQSNTSFHIWHENLKRGKGPYTDRSMKQAHYTNPFVGLSVMTEGADLELHMRGRESVRLNQLGSFSWSQSCRTINLRRSKLDRDNHSECHSALPSDVSAMTASLMLTEGDLSFVIILDRSSITLGRLCSAQQSSRSITM